MKNLLLILSIAVVGVVGAQKVAHYDSQKVLEQYAKAKQAFTDLDQFQNN